MVILGDFNHLGAARYAASHGYAWLSKDVGPTLPTPLRGFRLDHVLSRGLPTGCCLDAGVVLEAQASDHKPVWVELPLP